MVTQKPHELSLKPDGKGFYTVILNQQRIYHGRSASAAEEIHSGLIRALFPAVAVIPPKPVKPS